MAQPGLAIGRKAPAFSLANQDGQKVSLRDLAGCWTVLYFYPKDDTPGCTREACEFTAGMKQFEDLDVQVVGVSPDSPESHRRFIRKHDLKLQLLSDPDHTMLEKYGAWGQKRMYGRAFEGVIRSTVLIDPSGKVAYHWPKVEVAGHVQAVADVLREKVHG